MLYFGRFEITQPAGMSADQFLANWNEEAQAAAQATAAGVIKGLWKVSGQRVVLAVLDVPDNDVLDQALMGLPIFRSMGSAMKAEVLPIRPYESFAKDLAQAVGKAPATV
jgi:muconolactone delta-isomerase